MAVSDLKINVPCSEQGRCQQGVSSASRGHSALQNGKGAAWAGPCLGSRGLGAGLALWQRGRSERGLPWGEHLVPATGAAGRGKHPLGETIAQLQSHHQSSCLKNGQVYFFFSNLANLSPPAAHGAEGKSTAVEGQHWQGRHQGCEVTSGVVAAQRSRLLEDQHVRLVLSGRRE